jgi:thiosulfate/3-mercaptopyruvate sulfurtransferase
MDANTTQTLLEAPELATRLGDPSLAVIDCRWDIARPEWGEAAYAESHIPGAVFASMDRDLADPVGPATGRHPLPDAQRFAETLGRWGVDFKTQVVAYDQSNGAAASRLWWLMRWLGHAKVAVLDGGFAAWTTAGFPVTNAPASREPRVFTPRVRSSIVVSSADVAGVVIAREANSTHGNGESLQSRDGAIVVDARAADRFAGRNETIDPIAGHIPGAINHPFARNLDSSGKFLSPDELRGRWIETIGGHASENVIAMCGSGVTACHNLLALEVAGLKGARLYAGSWSEWIKDPARPVETGP